MVLTSVIAHAAVNSFQLEDQLRLIQARMANIKAQATQREVTVRFLDPSDFEEIVTDAIAWKQFIDELVGST